ncbi:MAG: hypothetical protein ABIJ96_15945 [Elusimicrobiota bacterium]
MTAPRAAVLLAVLLLLPGGLFASEEMPASKEHDPLAAVRPPRDKVSRPLRQALRDMQHAYWTTDYGRRLLALTRDIPVVERGPQRGAMVRFADGERPSFIVDPHQFKNASPLALEIAFILAREHALLRPPVPLLDAELAAQQTALRYVVQRAVAAPEFAARLRRATQAGEKTLRARKSRWEFTEDKNADGRLLYPGKRPADVLDRLGFDLYLFAEDPQLFYAAVEESARLHADAVTMTELEDFIERYGDQLDRGRFSAAGRYALMEQRAYPGRVLRAARIVGDREGLSRIRERLGPFRSVGQAELLKEVNRWIREGK